MCGRDRKGPHKVRCSAGGPTSKAVTCARCKALYLRQIKREMAAEGRSAVVSWLQGE